MGLQKVIDRLGLNAEIIRFSKPVTTTRESVLALGISPEQIVKSILLILDEKRPLMCILRGSDRIDFKALRRLYSINNIRTATPAEVLQHTGYEVGAVAPIIPDLESIADRRIMNYADVYGGGGTTTSLVKLSPDDILRYAKLQDFVISP
ncbi:MAG: YbaK/EbsC family protein [archaeon]